MGNNKIVIYDFNLNKETLTKKKEEITKNSNSFFSKAIQLSNDLVATADYNRDIDIWLKTRDGFSHLNQISLESDILDILPVNKEYLILIQYISQKIHFYDIKSLSIEKTLSKIDFSKEINSLLIFNNEIIIINCSKGFCIISIKTKEVIQYIEDFYDNYNNKDFCLKANQEIFVFYEYENQEEFDDDEESEENKIKININILVIKPIEIGFHVLEKYEGIKAQENLKLLCINNEDIIFWNTNIYLLCD